jgi:hypothetical protein
MGAACLQQFRGRPHKDVQRPHMPHHYHKDSVYSGDRRQFGLRLKHEQRNWDDLMFPNKKCTKWGMSTPTLNLTHTSTHLTVVTLLHTN